MVIGAFTDIALAQSKTAIQPPYRIINNRPQVPSNLVLGAVPGVQLGPDGNIYAFHRCGKDSCVDSNDPTILNSIGLASSCTAALKQRKSLSGPIMRRP